MGTGSYFLGPVAGLFPQAVTSECERGYSIRMLTYVCPLLLYLCVVLREVMSRKGISFLNPESDNTTQGRDICYSTGGWGTCLVSCCALKQWKGRIRVSKREGGVRVQVNPTQGHAAVAWLRSTPAVPRLSVRDYTWPACCSVAGDVLKWIRICVLTPRI